MLADVSNRSTSRAQVSSGHQSIVQEDVVQCLKGCKSRRNLAGWLASRLFSVQERLESNCRGACGKKALSVLKVKSICSCCMANYPLERLETGSSAEREMRNAIDEVCRNSTEKVKFSVSRTVLSQEKCTSSLHLLCGQTCSR